MFVPDDGKFGLQYSELGAGVASSERRRNTRHDVRWSATLVFDPRLNRPDMQSSTFDVSSCGASIFSSRSDLSGEVVGILLRPKVDNPKARPITLSVLARVVSAVPTPSGRLYRYGLSFVRPLDEVERLALSSIDCTMPEYQSPRTATVNTAAQVQ